MIKISLSWWKLKDIAKENAANYELLRKLNRASDELPSAEDCAADKGYGEFWAYINDPSDMPDWIFKRAEWEPVRPLKLMTDDLPDHEQVADAMLYAQVHLPGNELLKIRRVCVQENFCTDALQEELNKGWRIIAVCPQAGRRPDYILGEL